MDFELPEDVRAVGQAAQVFTRRHLIPLEQMMLEREWGPEGSNGALPPEVVSDLRAKSRELGLWGIDVPEEFGGLAMGALAKFEAIRTLSYSITRFTLPPDSPNFDFLRKACTPEQADRYLLPYVRGEKTSALAMSEPGAGSDAAAITTRAVRKNVKWVINGQKMWISNARNADFTILIAITDASKGTRGGMTAFLLDKGTPGVTISDRFPMIVRNLNVYAVYLDEVELGDEQVLGEVGEAFPLLQQRFGVRRIELAADSIGKAERCLDLMIEYANQRKTFGKLLADRQAIQFWIADSYQELEQVRLLAWRLAWRLDRAAQDDPRQRTIRREAAMLKVQATEMAWRVVDRAIQLYGGLGVSAQLPFEYMARSIRINRLGEGASEVHRWFIARDLLRDGMPN
jgi:(R)-benzylsuccinyl-CoA dehydrogenase